MNDEVFNKLKTFVFEQGFGYSLPFPLLFKRKIITRDTSLEDDLKIRGDDSDEFLLAFVKEFNVDVSNSKLVIISEMKEILYCLLSLEC